MKSNSTREIENILKEIFTPTYLVVEQSALVSKKFKILIVSSKFANKSSSGTNNDTEVLNLIPQLEVQKLASIVLVKPQILKFMDTLIMI